MMKIIFRRIFSGLQPPIRVVGIFLSTVEVMIPEMK